MKKRIISLVILVVVVLSACGNDDIKKNTVVNADLTEREKGILSTTSNQSFVFDFNIDSDYKEVSVWIEKYEFGSLVEEKVGQLTTEVKESGTIIFSTNKSNNTPNQLDFNIGVSSNGNTGSAPYADIISDKGTEDMALMETINQEMDINNGDVVLGSIYYYTTGEGGMVSLSSEFFNDVEGRMHELQYYDVAYLIRSNFEK
ncbi:hypothetical protein [Evansella cellulosilytica]|uniref:Lipoprotein n=1 Tax=Evansella cellulosilytica (strain ATCC 21833 / DSM 2522 / FERM P-1141 / JCM 9156 / N-4) TaxID=649639 RepID=E6U1G8_EVAC2|nr:hypothetical protein [Evansella cellulosilytica]ADU29215.1 hypothetical protein Bcell_0939 [Evansella cellulosilytica DSM 2522]